MNGGESIKVRMSDDVGLSTRIDARPGVLAALASRPILIVAVTILATLCGYAFGRLPATEYAADGHLFLLAQNDNILQLDRPAWVDPTRETRTGAQLVGSPTVIGRVAKLVGLPADELTDRISVVPAESVDVVKISARAPNPILAARLVNLVEETYTVVATERLRGPYDRAIAALEQSQRTLQRRLAAARSTAERQSIGQQIAAVASRQSDLTAKAALLGSGVRFADRANTPSAPIAPRPTRTAILAGLLGFFVALAAVWWRLGKTRRVREPETVALLLGRPLLGELPRASRGFLWHRRREVDDLGLVAAAVRGSAGPIFLTAADPAELTRRRVTLFTQALVAFGESPVFVESRHDGISQEADRTGEGHRLVLVGSIPRRGTAGDHKGGLTAVVVADPETSINGLSRLAAELDLADIDIVGFVFDRDVTSLRPSRRRRDRGVEAGSTVVPPSWPSGFPAEPGPATASAATRSPRTRVSRERS